MAFLPDLSTGNVSRSVVDTFGGYDHNAKIPEGSWYAERNLSTDQFPLLAPRVKRGVYAAADDTGEILLPEGEIRGICARDALAVIVGTRLIYDGLDTGLELSDAEEDLPKRMVSMGAYLCVFPDGAYINTQDLSDKGYMAAEYVQIGSCELSMCRNDGTLYDTDEIIFSDVEPDEPQNGQMWMDTSGDQHLLKQYSSTSSMWGQVPTVYCKISAQGIGSLFGRDDGVTISGIEIDAEEYGETVKAQAEALNTDCILQKVEADYVVVVGLIERSCISSGTVHVQRKVPRLSCVCEHENRLWGAYYGLGPDGKMLNEIYACALGDFKNWYRYAGLSTDSYAVSVGTDGEFTGCIAHLGHVLFFKENCIHKLFGNYPSNYQVSTTNCRGVQRGSDLSLAIVNEILYYKSRSDICAYDGSLPSGISNGFGNDLYYDAVAGSHGGKYYVSMRDAEGIWHLFVYDASKGIWHREDETHADGFTAYGDEIYFVDREKNSIIAENGRTTGEKEADVEWVAESGVIGYELMDHEYVGRFQIRMRLAKGARFRTFIEYDSDGRWIDQGLIRGNAGTLNSFVLPVIPQRCDHFRLRFEGTGDVAVYSMAKLIEQGGDQPWHHL